jgi:orotidine-5'-phosphate decarboxylase
MTENDAAGRIIIALDVKSGREGLEMAGRLDAARIFKVGLELFTAEGPGFLENLRVSGKEIFLDLKLHDIPNTVAGAVRSGARHGVRMMTLHAAGGAAMMAAAAAAARETADHEGTVRPLLLGVTVLTSLKEDDLAEIGMNASVEDQVLRLAGLARAAGLDGVVCSPREIAAVRRESGPDFLIITPGIRPAGADVQDQKRIMTPEEAVSLGSDYLVIGRPITAAPSPAEAFRKIAAAIRPK